MAKERCPHCRALGDLMRCDGVRPDRIYHYYCPRCARKWHDTAIGCIIVIGALWRGIKSRAPERA